MKQDFAEIGAMRVLAWLVGRDDLVEVFLGSSGASLDDLRARAAEPEFLASVLDFILMDDAWVLSCAEALEIRPEAVVQLRQALPGGGLPNWT
jgi:hypothetical protein